jgi:hypothetical protein
VKKKAAKKKVVKKRGEWVEAAKKKVAKKTGRPKGTGLFTKEVGDMICEQLAMGRSLRSICRDPAMPQESTVRTWLLNDPTFYAQYTKSRDIGLDAMADETMEISDNGSNDWMERHGEGAEGWVINGEHVQRSRLRVDTRKWYLSKLAPKRYGDRLQVDQTRLEDHSAEEIKEALQQKLKALQAQGIDVSALIK